MKKLALVLGMGIPALLRAQQDEVFHYSVMDAMRNGVYTGELTIAELAENGNFGLGTYNQLDGELIALDGVFYRIASDGSVVEAEKDRNVPFAAVSFFAPDFTTTETVNGGLEVLQNRVLQQLPSANEVYAIKIHITFAEITVGGAEKLADGDTTGLATLMKTRPIYQRKNVSGTIVGFYNPAFMSGVDLSPFHFHFLSDDRQFGGHLISGTFINATAKLTLDAKTGYRIVLPQNNPGYHRHWKTAPSQNSY